MFLKHDALRCGWLARSFLAATACVVMGLAADSPLRAQQRATQPSQKQDAMAILAAAAQPMSNAERYAKGVGEYKSGQYEEALADLLAVEPAQLGDRDKKDLDTYRRQSESASNQRKQARAEFELGEQALAGNRLPEAATHYRAAVNNSFADDGTKAKAREQLAVAESMMQKTGESPRDMYNSAVADYKAGNLQSARSKFMQLENSGYRAGLFQTSPSTFLKEINQKLATAPQGAAPTRAPAPQSAPPQSAAPQAPPPAVAPAAAGAAAGAAAVAAQQQSEPAPQPQPQAAPAQVAQPAPAPVVQTPPPAGAAAAGAAAVAAQPQNAQPEPAPQPQAQPAPGAGAAVVGAAAVAGQQQNNQSQTAPPPEPQPVVQTAPQPQPVIQQAPPPAAAVVAAPVVVPAQPAPTPPVDARAAYRLGQKQYDSGDWIAARRNFELARDNGYRAGLFDHSPQWYLNNINAKEQRDRAAAAAVTAGAVSGTSTAAETKAQQTNNREEAARLVEQAETARAANRLDEAQVLYARAAELDPNNNTAVRGRDELAQVLNRRGTPDLLAQQQVRIQQQRDFIRYSFDSNIQDANTQIKAQDFTKAQAAIQRARVARNENPGVFNDSDIRQFDATLAQTQTALDTAQQRKREQDAELARKESEEKIARSDEIRRREIESSVASLTREARQLVNDQKYEQALGVLDQIIQLDPKNDYALGTRPLVEDQSILQQQRIYRERYDRSVVRQYTAAEEEKIPYSDILRYADNWPNLAARRDRTVAEEQGQNSEDAAAQALLEKKLPEVKFDGNPLNDVIDFLRDVTQANIVPNWRVLEVAGIDRNETKINVPLKNVTFRKALETILKDASGGTVKLAYTVDQGVISISTAEDLAGPTSFRAIPYDIHDLLVDVPDFDQDAPQFQLQATRTGRGGGGGGGNLFGGLGQNQNQNQNVRATLVTAITDLVKGSVAADSWFDGGGSGTISEFSGQLIIKQTPENHRSIKDLLAKLRQAHAVQVTVEARFLTVQRNFLEEIGLDVDVLIPQGELLSQVGPVGIQNNSEAYTRMDNLTTSVPGNITTDLKANSTAGQLTPNFGISNGTGGPVTFLDDFQVNILLRATQISQNTTTLTAPRLTLFNGQYAYVAVSTDTAYVSDLTPVVANGAVAFDPTVAIVQSGVILLVRATVSDNKKYVTLTLRPTLQRLRGLTSFPISAVSNVTGLNSNTTQITTANIQQPVQDVTTLATTVSVPDRGTLLLGGQTLAGEIERDSGVPILSKIPFLKRLFTNSSMAKDEQVLLILVKPTIVIQQEQEQDQFPTMNSKY